MSKYLTHQAQVGNRSDTKTNILIGEPVNLAAGSASGTIYGTSSTYNQANILTQLKAQIDTSLSYPHVVGNMMWSVNADYDPKDYGVRPKLGRILQLFLVMKLPLPAIKIYKFNFLITVPIQMW